MIYIFVVLILPILIEVYYSFLTREQGTYTFHIVQKFTLDNYIEVFTQRYIIESLAFTIGISFVIAVGTVVLGMPVAQFLARGTGRGRDLHRDVPVAAALRRHLHCVRVALCVRTAGHRELVPAWGSA